MNRFNEILHSINETVAKIAGEMYGGKKRSDLKDSDFLFPQSRSFPIVTPQDVTDAISNFGRMKSGMSYDAFLRKLYNMAKRKGPEFVAALPEASKEKLGLKKKIEANLTQAQDNETPEIELEEYKNDFYEMSVGSIKAIATHAQAILSSLENSQVKENLTEPFLQGRIAITEDYMRMIHDYVMFSEPEVDTSNTSPDVSEDSTNSGDRPGLWDNIRKKKEREGKHYSPAKPGDKDRPDPEQWKKLTK
jgi:hypothetical protein